MSRLTIVIGFAALAGQLCFAAGDPRSKFIESLRSTGDCTAASSLNDIPLDHEILTELFKANCMASLPSGVKPDLKMVMASAADLSKWMKTEVPNVEAQAKSGTSVSDGGSASHLSKAEYAGGVLKALVEYGCEQKVATVCSMKSQAESYETRLSAIHKRQHQARATEEASAAKTRPSNMERYIEAMFNGAKCVPVDAFALYITKNMGSDIYEAHGNADSGAERVLLQTKSHVLSKGLTKGFKIKHTGIKELLLEDGFKAKFDLAEECE